jgi:uncharacterized membrane protein
MLVFLGAFFGMFFAAILIVAAVVVWLLLRLIGGLLGATRAGVGALADLPDGRADQKAELAAARAKCIAEIAARMGPQSNIAEKTR